MICQNFFLILCKKTLKKIKTGLYLLTSARMAESADATDLKSVAHKAYGFKSRSGYHLMHKKMTDLLQDFSSSSAPSSFFKSFKIIFLTFRQIEIN